MKHRRPLGTVATAGAPWQDVVFVCTKCMKRQDREELRGEIKQALKAAGLRQMRAVPCGCLDLCPDDGITIAIGSELHGTMPKLRVLAANADAAGLVEALRFAPRAD